ncbi:MAG: hypothetical protein R3F49_17375 [Planctomycetota bacterium]
MTKLARLDGEIDARCAKSLTGTLEGAWLAPAWDAAVARESRRAADGSEAAAALTQALTALGAAFGMAPTESLLTAAREARDVFIESNPALPSE